MDLADTLGLRPRQLNPIRRALQAAAASRPAAWAMSKFLHRLDRSLMSSTGGRRSLAALATGIPTVLLTTVGARSGLPRSSPLVPIPHGADLAVIGSGWGQVETPAWVHNLTATPSATLSANGVEIGVTARRADSEEAEVIWQRAAGLYRGYSSYRSRAAHRRIAVFVLSAE